MILKEPGVTKHIKTHQSTLPATRQTPNLMPQEVTLSPSHVQHMATPHGRRPLGGRCPHPCQHPEGRPPRPVCREGNPHCGRRPTGSSQLHPEAVLRVHVLPAEGTVLSPVTGWDT